MTAVIIIEYNLTKYNKSLDLPRIDTATMRLNSIKYNSMCY
jgi:hypothetical protein